MADPAHSNDLSVSIVIPAYNEEGYLGECLESVVRFRSPRIKEIIVINNASTDRTAGIASAFEGVRVVDEPEKGLTRARARGLSEAQGDLIAFLDADTRIHEEWPKVIAARFSANPNLVCLSGPYEYYDLSGLQKAAAKQMQRYLYMSLSKTVGYLILGGNFTAKKTALVAAGGFDKSIEFYGEDTDIARRLHKFGEVEFNNDFWVYTSGRRLKKHGTFRTLWEYGINYAWEIFFHRPLTKSYRDYR